MRHIFTTGGRPPRRLTCWTGLLATSALALALIGSLSACAARGAATPASADALAPDTGAESRAAALAVALPMPDTRSYDTRYLSWKDPSRDRLVAVKLYLPPHNRPAPLVVFSHGLGGSREGYSYMGKYWASQGYASLHLQHVGSDRSIWAGSPLGLVGRLQTAARESEAIDRVIDLRFALDQLLASDVAPRLDARHIVAAGHSYGANTTLLAAGAQVKRTVDGQLQTLNYRDPRIQAAVVISAPPFYGERDMPGILSSVRIPTLHITSTGDEINVPGYHSLPEDRVAVFEATGGASKTLAVFKDGSHSMFTDRLNTGGTELNPKVKVATRELALAFFQRVFDKQEQAMTQWAQTYQSLMARFDRRD